MNWWAAELPWPSCLTHKQSLALLFSRVPDILTDHLFLLLWGRRSQHGRSQRLLARDIYSSLLHKGPKTQALAPRDSRGPTVPCQVDSRPLGRLCEREAGVACSSQSGGAVLSKGPVDQDTGLPLGCTTVNLSGSWRTWPNKRHMLGPAL